MRTPLVVLALFLAACSTSYVDHTTLPGDAYAPIEVDLLNVENPTLTIGRNPEIVQPLTFQFNITNIDHNPVTIKKISLYQHGMAAVQLESALKGFNETIDPGKELKVQMVMSMRQVRRMTAGDVARAAIRMDVTLENGYSYVFDFEVPVLDTLDQH